jgi:ZIP family zinc transporter/zinc and cadmium transporter
MNLEALLFATIAGLGSVIGTFLVLWKEAFVRRWSVAAVSLAAGAMATTAVTHLFPEAVVEAPHTAPYWALGGFAAFFLLYQLVSFHACGRGLTHLHPIGTLALVGILVHSFFDGVAVGAAFGAPDSPETTGRVVTGAVFAHEVPEGAYTVAILLHTGMTRRRALFWAMVHGALTPIGAFAATSLSATLRETVTPALLGVSAGTFLYVAASNLVPEAQRESSRRNAFAFVIGLLLVLALTGLAGAIGLDHHHGEAEHSHAP